MILTGSLYVTSSILPGKLFMYRADHLLLKGLRTLQDEIGDSINIIEVPIEVEELISLVANKEIDYTVCDENVGRVNSTYYSNLDVDTPVSFPQNYGMGSAKDGSNELVDSLNNWINNFKKASLMLSYMQSISRIQGRAEW